MDDTKPPTIVDRPAEWDTAAEPASPRARYAVGDVLGRGGMGEVVSARDEQIGRTVAIKRLRGDGAGPIAIARFVREAKVQARLEHPAIVPVHELGFDRDGRPYFVMKQLAGVTLSTVLATRPRQELLRAFVDVCLAIEFAHTRGVIHRDLKPANIMLGDFGEVYVLDWGIAQIAATADHTGGTDENLLADDAIETRAGAVLGTPGYIAPEQIRRDVVLDGRVDVYALGCILFEILAGDPLIPPGPARLAEALVARDARPSARASDREIPPELDAICVRATALLRDDRFPTARALAEAVRRFLDGDRDLALRHGLAREALEAAHAALTTGDAGRRDALRHAARALALDPSGQDAAVLVGRLMLQPPKQTPSEVTTELRRRDIDDMRWSARFSVMAAVAYLAFVPIIYFVGIDATWVYVAIPALVAMVLATERFVVRRNPFVSGYLSLVCHLALLGVIVNSASEFLIGPAPACIITMVIATQPLLVRTWVLALAAVVVTLSPLILRALGIIDPIFSTHGSWASVRLAARDLDLTWSTIAMVVYCVALIALAAAMARSQDDARRDFRHALEVQSWQLRQLLPRA